MEYIIVAFRSRTHTVGFSNYLSKLNIKKEIINTPKEAGVGCGLSVKVSSGYFTQVKQCVFNTKLSSFAGFFLVKNLSGARIVRSI